MSPNWRFRAGWAGVLVLQRSFESNDSNEYQLGASGSFRGWRDARTEDLADFIKENQCPTSNGKIGRAHV